MSIWNIRESISFRSYPETESYGFYGESLWSKFLYLSKYLRMFPVQDTIRKSLYILYESWCITSNMEWCVEHSTVCRYLGGPYCSYAHSSSRSDELFGIEVVIGHGPDSPMIWIDRLYMCKDFCIGISPIRVSRVKVEIRTHTNKDTEYIRKYIPLREYPDKNIHIRPMPTNKKEFVILATFFIL